MEVHQILVYFVIVERWVVAPEEMKWKCKKIEPLNWESFLVYQVVLDALYSWIITT